jgi:hypothetical protein
MLFPIDDNNRSSMPCGTVTTNHMWTSHCFGEGSVACLRPAETPDLQQLPCILPTNSRRQSRPTGRYPYAARPAIVSAAQQELRRRYAGRHDPEHLLGPRFTLRELHDIREAIAATTLPRIRSRR